MEKGHFIEGLWMQQIETYVEMETKSKVMDTMALSLTNMDGYSIYDVLALELANLVNGLDDLGLIENSADMYAKSHMYNKIKYAVLEAAQRSLVNVVTIEDSHIRNVQIINEGNSINFIFNLSYANILHGLPA